MVSCEVRVADPCGGGWQEYLSTEASAYQQVAESFSIPCQRVSLCVPRPHKCSHKPSVWGPATDLLQFTPVSHAESRCSELCLSKVSKHFSKLPWQAAISQQCQSATVKALPSSVMALSLHVRTKASTQVTVAALLAHSLQQVYMLEHSRRTTLLS